MRGIFLVPWETLAGGFPMKRAVNFFVKDGLNRHGGAAQTAPFFVCFSVGGTVMFLSIT